MEIIILIVAVVVGFVAGLASPWHRDLSHAHIYAEGVADGVHATQHALGYCAFVELDADVDCDKAERLARDLDIRGR